MTPSVDIDIDAAERRAAARVRALLGEVARVRAEAERTRWVPHEPTERQAAFAARGELEVLYGGAAGGGKTDALLMEALRYVDVPGYAALVLRRRFSDLALPGAIMDRAGEWLRPTAAKWTERDKQWTFPSGATLTFGYCDTEDDRYRYQGAEVQFLGVDELTQWPERWYRYLLSRLRRGASSDVPLRARSASNPGGVGHAWVHERFVGPRAVGVFVPAKLEDNPHLDRGAYEEALGRLDETTRRQLRHGEWVTDGGGLVYRGFDRGRNVGGSEPKRCDEYVLGIDYGFRDETAFSLLGWERKSRRVWVCEVRKFERMIPSDAASVAREYEGRLCGKLARIVGDVGGMGKGYAEEARARWGVPIEPAEKVNKRGYVSLLNGALERGELMLVGGDATSELVKEWEVLPWNEAATKEAEGFANHAADATLYGWRACLAFLEDERPDVVVTEDERMEARVDDAMRREPWEGEASDDGW